MHLGACTAVVADLVHDIGRPEGTWTKLYTQAGGFYDRDCMDHCLAAVLIAEGRYAREPPAAGQMGVDPRRALRIAVHCVRDDCRSVYRPMEPRSCLAVCGGRRDFPTCIGQADACAPRAR